MSRADGTKDRPDHSVGGGHRLSPPATPRDDEAACTAPATVPELLFELHQRRAPSSPLVRGSAERHAPAPPPARMHCLIDEELQLVHHSEWACHHARHEAFGPPTTRDGHTCTPAFVAALKHRRGFIATEGKHRACRCSKGGGGTSVLLRSLATG